MAFLGGAGFAGNVAAASATEIEIAVDGGLEKFKKEVAVGAEFLDKAKGYLVFPKVTKAGLVVGGEYGEGALRVGKPVSMARLQLRSGVPAKISIRKTSRIRSWVSYSATRD